jgi:hypothetical protein
MLTVG